MFRPSTKRATACADAGATVVVLDIAHGHAAEHAIEGVRRLKGAAPQVQVIAGNVATAAGALDLVVRLPGLPTIVTPNGDRAVHIAATRLPLGRP